jgi:hypothetical protein
MPSVDDVYNQLLAVNGKLDTLHNDLTTVTTAINAVQAAVTQVNATLTNGFGELVTLGQYTNQALYQNDQQNDTIICILEHIAKNTCSLLNESTIQTALQTEMESDIDGVESMIATANPAAALERKRLHELKEKIEECCPPKKPAPPCDYRPCTAPKPNGPPPQVGPPTTR